LRKLDQIKKQPMQKLKDTFEKIFDLPFSILPLPKYKLYPIGKSSNKALLFGSKMALKKLFLVQGQIFRFTNICSQDYFLVGFWGHGVNSYAFYYSRCDEWSKICFRLPYGGVYMDNKEAASDISKFLSNYFKFEKQVKKPGSQLVAIDAMHEALYKLKAADGKKLEYNKSLLTDPNFSEILNTGVS
jgi:hypothetical protein